MATKSIQLQLHSTIEQPQKEIINTIYEGKYKRIGHDSIFRFRDDEMGNMTLKYDHIHQQLTCLWEKHLTKRMVFRENESTPMQYHLGNGILVLTVKTTNLSVLEQDDQLVSIHLSYTLKQEGILFGKYRQIYKITYME